MAVLAREVDRLVSEDLQQTPGTRLFRTFAEFGYKVAGDPSQSLSRRFAAHANELHETISRKDQLLKDLREASTTIDALQRRELFENIGKEPVKLLRIYFMLAKWGQLDECRRPFRAYWRHVGNRKLAIKVAKRAYLRAAQEVSRDRELPWIYVHDIAWFAASVGDHELASSSAKKAESDFTKLAKSSDEADSREGKRGRSHCLMILGELAIDDPKLPLKSRFGQASTQIGEAFRLASELDDKETQADTLLARARISTAECDWGAAEGQLEQAIELAFAAQNNQLQIRCFTQRGDLWFERGDLERARADFIQSSFASAGSCIFEHGYSSERLACIYERRAELSDDSDVSRLSDRIAAILHWIQAVEAYGRIQVQNRLSRALHRLRSLMNQVPPEDRRLVSGQALADATYPFFDTKGIEAIIAEELDSRGEVHEFPAAPLAMP